MILEIEIAGNNFEQEFAMKTFGLFDRNTFEEEGRTLRFFLATSAHCVCTFLIGLIILHKNKEKP